MFTVPTRFPGADTAGVRVIANAWTGYYTALLSGDPAASAFAEWVAGYWVPALDRPSGPPDTQTAVVGDVGSVDWFERDGWVSGHIPGNMGGYLVPSANVLEHPWVTLVESAA